jgi:tetratricopeptide (TPR) repeat protein
MRGRASLARKDFDKALADCNETIRLEPTNAYAYALRGRAWSAMNEDDKAISDFSRAIQLEPANVQAHQWRGDHWFDNIAYEKAISDYDRANRLSPDDADACRAFASFLATCPVASYRDGKRAVELATKACILSQWSDADAFEALAAARAEVGEFDMAVQWQTKANVLRHSAADRDEGQARLKLYQETRRPLRKQAR